MKVRKLCIERSTVSHNEFNIFISYCEMGKLGALAAEDLPTDSAYHEKVLARDAAAKTAGATHKVLYVESQLKLSCMESAGNKHWVTDISYKPTHRRYRMTMRLINALRRATNDTLECMLAVLPLKPVYVLRVDGELYATLDPNMNLHTLRARLEA